MFRWTLDLTGGPWIYGPAAVAVGDTFYCFSRRYDDDKDQIGVHVFNSVSLRWRTLPLVTPGGEEHHFEVPSSCWGHSAVLVEDTVYLWGGRRAQSDEFCNILYAFDVDAHGWFKPRVSGFVPEARMYHSACVLGKVMFIHGGRNQHHHHTNDTYTLDTTTMVWSLINARGTPPPASECHSANIIGTKMFVFGGRRGGQCYNTIRVFDTESNSWLSTPSSTHLPEERCCHSAFTYNGEIYICGGQMRSQTFNDLWKFTPESFSWNQVVEPKGEGPSKVYRMCCCMVGDRIILSGGLYTPTDVYVLDLSPKLKTLCKLAVIQYAVDQSELPHDIRGELEAMPADQSRAKSSEGAGAQGPQKGALAHTYILGV